MTELLSKPIRYGYMNGIALTVLISQLPKLFGFSIESDGPLRDLWAIGRSNFGRQSELGGVRDRRRHAGSDPAAQEQQACARNPDRGRWRDRRSSACSTWPRAPDVSVLGPLPQGLPGFTIPWITYADIVPVLLGGCAVALVSFADTSVLSRAYAARTGTNVDPNQEMVGLGAANLAAGFFQGFPDQQQLVAHAGGRGRGRPDPVDRRGRRARRCLLLLAAPNLLQHLPTAALAAVVIASAIGLFEVEISCESFGSSAGSSGCRSSASWASRCLAPSRESAWRS